MRADILQAVAICAYGNPYLQSEDKEKAPDLHAFQSTFRAVHECAFERKNSTPHGGMDPEGTAQWYKKIRSEGAVRIELALEKCAFDPQQQGTTPWGLIVTSDRGVEIWTPSWKKRSFDPKDLAPWLVIYTGDRYPQYSIGPSANLDAANAKIAEAMTKAIEFCRLHGARNMDVPIQKLLEMHGLARPEMSGFDDMCPEGHPVAARALMASAIRLMAVLHSQLWRIEMVGEESHSEYRLNTGRLWLAAMFAFEAAAIESQKEEPSTGSEALPQAS